MRYHKLDLNLLAIFDSLMTERSVSSVARRLNLSQSTISNALARLRTHFDDELFRLVDRSMQPTVLALSIAEDVRSVLTQLETIATARAHFDPATSQRTFSFVASDQAYLTVLISVIRELRTIAPGVKIQTSSTPDQGSELLRRGAIDFILNPDWNLAEDLPSLALFSDQAVCVAWEGNEFLTPELTLDQFCSLGHVETMLRPGTNMIDELLARMDRSREIATWAPNFSLVIETLPYTNFIASIGRRVAAHYAGRLPIRLFESPLKVPDFKLMLQWNASREGDPGMVWMRDLVQRVAGEQSIA